MESVQETTANVVVRLVPNGDNVIVSVEYKDVATNTTDSIVSTVKYSGSEAVYASVTLSGLKPGTKYNYTFTATNTAGSSSASGYLTTNTTIPPVLVMPIAVIKEAVNVKFESATVSAIVIPNQPSSVVSIDYRQANDAEWTTKILGSDYSGADSLKVSLDLSSLTRNTVYQYRLTVENKAGKVVSDTLSFKTYAVKDYDGNMYHIITIGTQTWLQENLRTTHYANGDPITHVSDPAKWIELESGAWTYYDNDPKNGEVYGALYNWYVGADPRGLIVGWHTPLFHDFIDLLMSQDTSWEYYAGKMLMEEGHVHWGETSRVATNSSGFTALPNGFVDVRTGVFSGLKDIACLWGVEDAGGVANKAFIDSQNCYFNPTVYSDIRFGYGLRLMKN
ncbi:MAG: FISUMP domain-containing protein [Patescibacteria group bacterium]